MKEKLIKYFENNEKVIMAFLYGSYAREHAMADSDVDIAVFMKGDYSSQDVDQVWDDVAALLKKDVEILVLNDAKEGIAWSAIRGIPLVIKDWKLYLNYMLSVSFEAMELQNIIEDIWKMKRRLKHA